MIISTCASRSPAVRMQAVSCEIRARSENELSEGIYPSAIDQRRRPIASMAVPPFSAEMPTPKPRFSLHPRGELFCACGVKVPSEASSGGATAIQSGSRDDMRAITVSPGIANSARLDEVPEPPLSDGSVLVRTRALGVCATDREILSGVYGSAPPGEQRLVLGHESLGTVMAAPEGSGLSHGDVVVGIVRRPDPEPCMACAAGEWDMCRNGRYTERGIKERHGYGAERFRLEPEFAIKIDPALGILGVLLEPASILAKAWDHIERIGHRARAWQPKVLLATGAGPIGLLAAVMGRQRGPGVHLPE